MSGAIERGRGNTTQRDRLRRHVAHGSPPCWLCGGSIDYSLRYPHPESFTVDHMVAINLGGRDDVSNAAASHFRCNRAKSDKPLAAAPTTPVPVVASPLW